MTSLIKCAKCGKKPTVRPTTGDRSGGAARSVSITAKPPSEVVDTPADRPASRGRGPERFFYDRSTYTGTHARGGPEAAPKGVGSTRGVAGGPASLPSRPSSRPSSRPGTPAKLRGNPVADLVGRAATPARSRVPALAGGAGNGPVELDLSAAATAAAAAREEVPMKLRGPERFFYDKNSYTGTHARGGPASVPKGAGTSFDQSWKRER